MSKKVKVVMISGWHVHAMGYANYLAASPSCEIVGVWDEIPVRGTEWASDLKCKYYDSYDEVLSDPNVDAVAICAPTSMHTELMLKAANASKHIFTEKVLTLSVKDALAVKKAINKNKVHFTISFPHETDKAVLFAKDLVDREALGQITYMRVRNVHSGSINDWLPAHFYNRSQCGGGAMIDLGAHPMYLICWFLGAPKFVSSTFTSVTARPVEDNAVSVLQYENGAIAVSETGFVSVADPYSIEFSGTKGYLRISGGSLAYSCPETENKTVTLSEFQTYAPLPLDYWIDSIVNGTQNQKYTIDEAVELTKIMEAAYRSSESGKKIKI
ncbi:MAG: Gfo/Idh/MocA family oxidoreductase [Clostridia bacterium]|nr:Gfo/Idh/MocA family oxidoreductase [Clostridia bacterium]